MKYKVLSSEQSTTSQGKPMWKVILADPEGVESNLNVFDKLIVGEEVEGQIYRNDKGYLNFKSAQVKQTTRPNYDRIMEKKQAGIAESQTRKEQSIKAAQDRSAWMWAKTNATELMKLVPDPLVEDKEMLNRLHELATKIYNMEPFEPFTE